MVHSGSTLRSYAKFLRSCSLAGEVLLSLGCQSSTDGVLIKMLFPTFKLAWHQEGPPAIKSCHTCIYDMTINEVIHKNPCNPSIHGKMTLNRIWWWWWWSNSRSITKEWLIFKGLIVAIAKPASDAPVSREVFF